MVVICGVSCTCYIVSSCSHSDSKKLSFGMLRISEAVEACSCIDFFGNHTKIHEINISRDLDAGLSIVKSWLFLFTDIDRDI